MKKNLYRTLIELTNHKMMSVLLMKFSRSKVSKFLIEPYSKHYELNWDEVEQKQEDFRSLHEVFIRKLREGARTIHNEPNTLVSPVDAIYDGSGAITSGKEIIVKGKPYSIQEMLGDDEALQKYIGGQYVLLYLSPSHYHRIHSPVSGEVTKRWSLGKNSYPVNRIGMKYGKAPLSKNYRVITEMNHQTGSVAIVKVGAMFINSVEITNQNKQLHTGEEMAYFSFGSTVVLLFEKGTFELANAWDEGSQIKYGECLGNLKQPKN